MSATILESITLETETCCNCGVVFAMPQSLVRNFRESRRTFYCPNGHGQSYTTSESAKLKKELESVQSQLRASKCEVLNEQNRRQQVEIEKQKIERKLKRVKNGTCPCCNRSFENLRRHMETKHPENKL